MRVVAVVAVGHVLYYMTLEPAIYRSQYDSIPTVEWCFWFSAVPFKGYGTALAEAKIDLKVHIYVRTHVRTDFFFALRFIGKRMLTASFGVQVFLHAWMTAHCENLPIGITSTFSIGFHACVSVQV